jgi:hypothetical protein
MIISLSFQSGPSSAAIVLDARTLPELVLWTYFLLENWIAISTDTKPIGYLAENLPPNLNEFAET